MSLFFSDTSTEEYLEEYLARSRKLFEEHKDDSLYLLCIQCFEVRANMVVCYGISWC